MCEVIKSRVLKIIKNLELKKEVNTEKILYSNYVKEDIFTSLTFVKLIVLLEEEFEIEIDSEYLLIEDLPTFSSIIELIKYKIS